MNKDTYKTTTLDIAAFLTAKSLPLLTIEREGKQCTFVFPDSDELRQLIESFLYAKEGDDDTQVDARKMLSAMKGLKFKMYSQD